MPAYSAHLLSIHVYLLPDHKYELQPLAKGGNSKKFEVVDELIDEECFNPTFYGSLCSLGNGSFVYAILGYFCHIEKENGKYKVMFFTRESMYGLYGFGGILLSEDRRYILSSTNYRNENISIYKCIN
jgi:hypothetical protein